MNKYKIYCETDGWLEVIASAAPTVCPIDGGHTINTDSITVVERDIKVNDGSYTELTLADYKTLRYNEIDSKTGVLIAAGFIFDGSTFSLSAHAQMNWSEIHSNQASFTFPLTLSCLNSDTYDLAAADVENFWGTAMATVKGHLDSGRVLKKQIFDAVDEAAVDAVTDNR